MSDLNHCKRSLRPTAAGELTGACSCAWSGSEAIGCASLIPSPRHEVVDVRGGPEIDELVEDVSDIGLRFDVVELARLNQRSDAGPVLSPLVMPSKQRILAIEHQGSDTAPDNVRVKFDPSIV